MKEKETTVEEVVEETTEVKVEEPKKEKKKLFEKHEDAEKERLQNKIKKLEEEKEILQDKVLRVNAEMQNMRRRMEEEKSNLLRYEGEDLIKDILPIIDTFERAIGIPEDKLSDEVKKFLDGFKLIYGNIGSVFRKYEIEEMDILNKPFDPNMMEAVLVEEVSDMESNMVVDVLQKGYTYKGKVVRHAFVKVSK